MTPARSVALLLAALLGIAGVATAPAAPAAPAAPVTRVAADEGGVTVRTTEESVEVGTRPVFEVTSAEPGPGRFRIAVLSTFGKGKGLPKDKREWQTRVAYDGEPLRVDGPYLRVGSYRVKVWFVPTGTENTDSSDGSDSSDGAETPEPQATTTFSVHTVDASTSSDDEASAASADDNDSTDGSALRWVLLTMAAAVLAGAVLVAYRLLGRKPGRRRIDDAPGPASAPTTEHPEPPEHPEPLERPGN
ncbi:hypothetical protein GUY44_19645 [Pimelobacter simplex]|uniref:Uncharacterized protein n=1 Tax=Nocardioides simplex TaxID=2045 RepID=A0A0A1DMR6_NOCSI|nr:hypothetical protein [Pimelobacter simplex]AIY17907.1 hypothetical protein KR76_16060 [Pimelobacter simplex]MCG8152706.1 hypothetical protein [Pimelobacter simplex]GEB16922.1 hypothetical protein NSI01_52370 [Pimelobacter simplex]SFM74662.1 hypothetical protein SAMN05421671_3296 [Pimelobacter simplex]